MVHDLQAAGEHEDYVTDLHVSQFPPSTTEKDLYHLFLPHAALLIHILRRKDSTPARSALVRFDSLETCREIIKKFNGHIIPSTNDDGANHRLEISPLTPQQTVKSHISLRARGRGGGIDKYPAKSHALRVAACLSSAGTGHQNNDSNDNTSNSKTLILLAGTQTHFYSDSDIPLPFRQDRYFYYFSGCDEPGCYITYDVERDWLTLWLPEVDLGRVFYDGRGSTVEEAMERYDVDEAVYLSSDVNANGGGGGTGNLGRYVREFVRGEEGHEEGERGTCLFLPERARDLSRVLKPGLRRRGKALGWSLRDAMDACRAVKDEHEIALVRKANAISSEAHTKIMRNLHRLESEPEVEGLFVGTCTAMRAKKQSYSPICGAGKNASVLHYVENDQDFGDSSVLLIDAGAEWQNYASDITRTLPLNPRAPGHWPTPETRKIHSIVQSIQTSCIALLRPGAHFIDINFHGVHEAISALRKIGLLKGEQMEIFHAGTVGAFYPHGLGHHVGLEVHDVNPPLSSLADSGEVVGRREWKGKGKGVDKRFEGIRDAYERFSASRPHLASILPSSLSDEDPDDPANYSIPHNGAYHHSPSTPLDPPLAAGNIVTIEPGIYFNAFVLETFWLNDPVHRKFIDREVLERYMHVGGVRIEDCVLVTKGGWENLTGAPKGEEMLEVIRKGAEEKE